jgi:signal transduction histidine kinase
MSESRARVLFIEDDMGKRYVIARQLRQAGYEIDEAETGEQGLSLVKPTHDVVVLDLRLPDLHGWEVCRRIKSDPELDGVMVLELSATLSTAQDRAKGLALGADAYLVHPVELVELAATIDALVRLRRAVNERDKQRELFVAAVGHDLRNPLAAVVSGLDVLKLSPVLQDKERGVIGKIDRNVVRMLRLIDQLLVFTQTIAGKMSVAHDPIPLVGVVTSAIAELGQPDRTIELVTNATPTVAGDSDRLVQLVDNLVSNAIKHGVGPVTVTLAATDADAVLTVHNGGTPIPPSALPTLFEPFHRASARTGGFGLGLYIVSGIAKAHGGATSVTSTAEAGTTFTVRLPLAH